MAQDKNTQSEINSAAQPRYANNTGSEISIMELTQPDIDSGFLESLDNLISGTSKLDRVRAIEILQEIKSNPLHKIFVAKVNRRDSGDSGPSIVAGTTTLLVEPKFIFQGGRVGHIEDVSIRRGFEKKGIGSKLVSHVSLVAHQMGCVKLVLDCSNETMPFYEDLGFTYQDNCMKKLFVT
jgi:glucosamine-phosphate N-acetyltransferase